jgi:hypothetical protein
MISLMVINNSFSMEDNRIMQLSDSSSSGSFGGSLTESLMYYAPSKDGLSNIYSSVISYAPTKDGLSNVYNSACSTVGSIYEKAVLPAATSLYNTADIKLRNDRALIKLGYPITNLEAQTEMKKNLESYIVYYELEKKLSTAQANYNTNEISQQYNSKHELILRRKEIVERIAPTLKDRLDGLNVAKHLLTYHDHPAVMTAPTKNIISLFMIAQEEAEKDASSQFITQLNQLMTAVDNMQQVKKDKEKK